MSEIAVVSARTARLQKLADDGSPGARSALELSHEPFGLSVDSFRSASPPSAFERRSAKIADLPTQWLAGFAWLEPYARPVDAGRRRADGVSVVIGELVPKRLGLLAPEAIACSSPRR